MPGRRLLSLLRVAAIAAMATFSLVCAYAAEPTPNLFESLGKFFQPRSETPAAEASPPAETSTPARNLARQGAPGGRRIALVIGNGAYKADDLKPLANPPNDADDVAAALRGFGFEVLAHKNLDRRWMKDAIAEFGRKAHNAEAALFYYAGHGIQIKNQNYLIPVDALVRSEADVADEGINVNFPLEELDNARTKVNVVILDACRNNDFSGRFRGGGSRGLAPPGNVPKGTVIVYATDPGNTASDGTGRNGLFTAGLLTAFKGDDLSLDGVLTTASAVVEEKSGGKQTPYVNGPQLVKKNFYFIFKGPTTVQVQPTVDPEGEAWKAAQAAASVDGYQAYLASYPRGRYAAAAKVKLSDLKKTDKVAGAATLPTTVAVEDPETQFWNEVKASGAREYFDAYLKQYPKGKYLALARIELKKLEDRDKAQQAREGAEKQQAAERERQEAQRAEQTAWDEAKTGASIAAYAGYLERYPKGRYVALAQAAQQKLQREAAEREKQDSAQRRQEEERQRSEAERQKLATERERQEANKAAGDLRPGKVFRDCADCPEMVVIPAGSFKMGGEYDNEKPVHHVSVRSFAIGRTEVTQGQWQAMMGSNPSHLSTCGDNCPVELESWDDAQQFLRRLSGRTGKTYRLPSEAEWEYACRAGGRQEYCGGDSPDKVAWSSDNSGRKIRAVAGKSPNAWGLYDMSGNIREATADCWHENYFGAPANGGAWEKEEGGDCGWRVFRGGSWAFGAKGTRAATRYRDKANRKANPDIDYDDGSGISFRIGGGRDFVGFRPVRMLP